MAQTSDRISHIAAKLLNIKGIDLDWASREELDDIARDVRALAASALRQDETKGKRDRFRFLERWRGPRK